MPPEAEVQPEFLKKRLKDWKIFRNGTLKTKADPVWVEIKKELNLKMNASSLYLYVYANRHNCRTELEEYFHIPSKKRKIERNTDPDFLTDEGYCNNPHGGDILNFDISTQLNQIVDLATKTKQADWHNEIKDRITEAQNLPCIYQLKDGYFTKNSFKFKGKCRECETSISGIFDLPSTSDDALVKIQINTFSTLGIPHKGKRQLTGKRREKVGKILSTKTATEYREEQIGKLNTDVEPPDLNTTITLKKLREETINKASGYSEFKGLSITNNNFIERCNIKKLSLFPLYVCYWSPAQVNFWNSLQDSILPLSIDATGGVVKKYLSCSGKILFYYVLVIGYKKKIFPVLQVISSIHHVLFIKEFLEKWIEEGAKIPREISTDGSLALQNGITLAFNKMTYKMYNNHCFEILTNTEKNLPNCYYRHDVAHLINCVRKWKCFDKSNLTTVDFYVRSVGYLTQVENLQEFENILISIIIICNSTVSDESSQCHQRRSILTNIFKTYRYRLESFIVLADNVKEKSENEYIPEEETDGNKDSIMKYIDAMFDKGISLSDDSEEISEKPNYLYCPQFLKHFKNLCYSFVSWTNVMKKHFKSPNNVGSSARSEAYFKKRKQNSRSKQLLKFILEDNIKIHQFIKAGNLLLGKKINDNIAVSVHPKFDLAKLKIKSHSDEPVPICNQPHQQKSLEERYVVDLDHSYGKKQQIENASITETMEIFDSDLTFANNDVSSSSVHNGIINNNKRKLILNGNKLGPKIYDISSSSKELRFQNTCPFDSVLEIMITMYLENDAFKRDMKNKQSGNCPSIFNCIVDYCENNFNIENVYNFRSNMLYSFYGNAAYSTKSVIECNDNVGNVLQKLMKPLPTVIKHLNCSECGYQHKQEFYDRSVSASQFYDSGIKFIDIYLNEDLRDSITFCMECANKALKVAFELSSYFVIDVEFLHEEINAGLIHRTVKNVPNVNFTTDFSKIPQEITLKNEDFELIGVIAFEGNSKTLGVKALAHYKAYTFSGNDKWVLYNDLASDAIVLEYPPKDKIALIIYTKTEIIQ